MGTQNIRVWRSLVSRLTGGQEAAGSSPVTRTIFSIKTADFQRFLSFIRTFLTLSFFAVVARPGFDPYQQNFRERRFFLPALPVLIADLLLFLDGLGDIFPNQNIGDLVMRQRKRRLYQANVIRIS